MRPIKSLSRILVSASGLALATAILAQPTIAHAQSFQGTVGSVVGTATVVAGTNTTNVTVSGPSAVINWIPNDNASTGGPIIFQTAGTTATFTGVSGDFAVLNRIIPTGSTRPIQFNGTVRSEIANSGLATPGGTIFFYSPGGILVGSNAIFDIGNLGLTTSDVPYASNGRFDAGVFQPVTVAGSGISILPGAQINAPVDGSYVALVAPRVENGGSINVNGSAALVAADAATLTFSPSGLFDIQVDSGTSATGTVAANTGSITGSAGTSALNHRIYMVAVAKNEAISMALGSGSTLGFDIAAAADVVGNSIVLSGGRDVIDGAASSSPSVGSGTGKVSISVTDAAVTSNFVATTNGGVNLNSVAASGLKFAYDAIVAEASGASSGISADGAGNVSVARIVSINGNVFGTADAPSATGQSLAIRASNGGTIAIGGNVGLTSQGFGAASATPGTPAGNGLGGLIQIAASDGGQISIAGGASLLSAGRGGGADGSATAAGTGTGGDVDLLVTGASGSSINIGELSISSTGSAGYCLSSCFQPGDSLGGFITMSSSGAGGGGITIIGRANFQAIGTTLDDSDLFGSATGGTVLISASEGATLKFDDYLAVSVLGQSSYNEFFHSGGAGRGGNATLNASHGGTVTVTGSTNLNVSGQSGGGLAAGGRAEITLDDQGIVQLNNFSLSADGLSNVAGVYAAAGRGQGGTARIFASASSQFSAASGSISAGGYGGTNDIGSFVQPAGPAAIGGEVSIQLIDAGATLLGDIELRADGLVSAFGLWRGVRGLGGNASVDLLNSSFEAGGSVRLVANGNGDGNSGGNGFGGTNSFTINNSTASLGQSLIAEAIGQSRNGSGIGSAAAPGTGGAISITVNAGQLTVGDSIQLNANGIGYATFLDGDGGSGIGGSILLAANGDARGDSVINAPIYRLSADGLGADGFGYVFGVSAGTVGGAGLGGGNGQGGTVSINAAADGGTISGGHLDVSVTGRGGQGGDGQGVLFDGVGGRGGDGGSGQGGIITIDSLKGTGAGSGELSFSLVDLDAFGLGGAGGSGGLGAPRGEGGNGGSGLGGNVNVQFQSGNSQMLVSGRFSGFAVGSGGQAGDCDDGCLSAGGTGTGGKVFFGSTGDSTGNSITLGGALILSTDASGGDSQGAIGGSATGGETIIKIGEGQIFSGTQLALSSIARGGSAASEGTAGAGQGGTASIITFGTGVISASGAASVATVGVGGAGLGAKTIAGAGTGGTSRIFADGGTLSFGGVSADAVGLGGNGNQAVNSGAGGIGTGGVAEIVTGLQAGGNPNTSTITVANRPSTTSTIDTVVNAHGFGGRGYAAGAGIGGRASVYARLGSIDLSDTAINAGALGGSGTAGGAGGAGIGGVAEVYAQNNLSGPSRIISTQLNVSASGAGGIGGSLNSVGTGGGNGGRGIGGQVRVFAGAGNGNLEANILEAFAIGAGGAGGAGNGAAGGNGGDAFGGDIQLGSFSGSDTGALNLGAASFGSVRAQSNATGGAGGAGDNVTAGAVGGNGGNASSGRATLLVRGSTVTVSDVGRFESIATGGDGGVGFSSGAGGNAANKSADPKALPGGSFALVTNRFNQPTQRGNLIAGDLSFTTTATGGSGSTNGTATHAGNALAFQVVNSSVSAANLTFKASSDSLNPIAVGAADLIALTNATATVSGAFDFNTVGAMRLQLDQSSLTADTVAIAAENWLKDPLAPAAFGTLTGTTSLSLTSGQDIAAYAKLSTQGDLALSALGQIDLGIINALGAVSADAGSTLTLDDVVSGSTIELDALGEVLVGNLTSAASITIDAQGNVMAGSLTAGTGTPTGVNGDLHSVVIRSGGSVTTDAIFAAADLGIVAADAITAGQVTAYDMLLLGSGNVSTGGLNAVNRVLIADASMAELGQTAAGFEKDLVFAGSPVRTAGSINLSAPASASAFTAAAQGTLTSGAITVTPSATGSGDLRIDTGGAITTTNLTAANALSLSSALSIKSGTIASETGSASLAAPTITLGNVQTASGISISGQTVSAGNLAAGVGSVSATGTHTIQTGAITVDGAITVAGGSETTVASALATNGSVGIVSAGELSLGNITSGDSIDLTSLGALIAGDLTSAASITIDAQGNVTAGSLTAGTGTPTGVNGDLHSVVIRSGGSVSTDAIFAAADLGIVAADAITAGQVTAYDMLLLGSGNVSTGGLNAVNRVLIADASMAELGQTAAGFEKDLVFAGSPVRTAGSINLSAPASASAFTAAAQGTLTSGAITVTPSATGSGDLRIDTGGAITTTNLTAANAVSLVSATSIQTGAVTSQTSDVTFAAPTITLGNVQTASGISISGQTVSAGNLAASAGSVSATGTQTIQTGAITADGAITVAGGSETTVASASASKGLIEVTATGALEIGDATAGVAGVRLIAGSTTASGGLQSGQGSITAGNVQAAGLVQLYAGGTVASEALGSSLEGVKVASFGGAVRTGEISVLTNVLVSAVDSVSIGGAIKARDVILLSGGNVSAGDVFAGAIAAASGGPIADATGRVLIANRSMAADRLLRSVTSDYSTLLADAPVAVGGTVKVDGDVVTGRFAAFSKGNMTGGRISAFQNLEVESGGLVTVGQRWAAPALQIASSDIRVVDNGSSQSILSGLHSTAAGTVSLISMSGSPALIGDGLTGSGYALSDAELALVSAGEISIAAVDNSANATDMLIGNLSLTAGETVGISNVAGSTGRIVFSTGDRASQVPGGAIRIVGNLTGTGFASTNAIEFNSDRFELDAATGYLSLTQTGTALGGVVEIAAANIHVATGSILDRLAADPFYSGHLTDLDRPAARQRPDGVLRALGLDLFPKRTLYIQNTGTIFDPAGFFADFDSTSLTAPANDLSSSVSVIVNGKWQTRNGIASGTDAHDLVTESASRSDFKADSSVNGCAITAAVCVSQLTRDPTPAISSQIQVTLKDSIGSTPQFAEDLNAPGEPESDYLMEAEEQVQKAAADEGKATPGPIAPRPQIVDMTSLQSQPQIAQPVTGSGKPSLVGTLADEGLTEGAEQ